MMALDPLNTLDLFPLPGLWYFLAACEEHKIAEVNLTGSNTDPLLYKHHGELTAALRKAGVKRLGIRTNGVGAVAKKDILALYDKGSISITSLNPEIYKKTMGIGEPPDVSAILDLHLLKDLKINIVLCPETVESGDIFTTLDLLWFYGFTRVNLREPYGQPHIGYDWLVKVQGKPDGMHLGMPYWKWVGGMEVTYWDVHYVEVESVNLYANGRVSITYPVTKGHVKDGIVQSQEQFTKSGRVNQQWLKHDNGL
jgi:hypothetical protein